MSRTEGAPPGISRAGIRQWVLAVVIGLPSLLSCTTIRSTPDDRGGTVATVCGRAIRSTELIPSDRELEWLRVESPQLTHSELVAIAMDRRLSEIIWSALIEVSGFTASIEPSADEVEAAAISLFSNEDLSAIDEPIRTLSSRQFAYETVKKWKLNKLLFERYDGDVIYPLNNPMEPIEACRSFLREREKCGDFDILDCELRERFWRHYVWDPSVIVSRDEVDYSRPWWTKIQ